MRRFLLLSLSLLMTGIITAGNVTGKVADRLKRMNAAGRSMVYVQGMNDRSAKAMQLKKAGLWAAPSKTPMRVEQTTDPNIVASVSDLQDYGTIYGPDGDTWFYNRESVKDDVGYYKSAKFVIYDSKHNVAANIQWTCPEDKKVNSIYPHAQVTNKMFDNDANTQEVVFFAHYVLAPGETIDSTFIYNLEGDIVQKYEGSIADVFDIKQSTTTVQRAILQRQENQIYNEEDDVIFHFDVLKPMGWGDTAPTVEHTFSVPFNLTNYSDEAPCFSVYTVEDSTYYVLSHYKEPYVDGYDPESLEMIVHENNEFVIDVYNSKYEKKDSFGVKLDKPEDALYRMAGFSLFSDDDMSRNFYTDNGELNYVIGFYDYYTSSDDTYNFTFQVFNGKGELKKTICENVIDWFSLSDLRGHEQQWACLQTVGNAQQVRMVDVPSCETATIIPAQIDGENISFTIDRYSKGDDYQYVIKLLYADADADGNVISRIGWYNKDLTLDHYVKFNLGPNGQNFTPLLYNESLDPYLFDTDDEHEYVYIATIKRDNSTVMDDVMVIAKEDGTVIRELRGDEANAIYTGGIINYGLNNPEFYAITRSTSYPTTYDMKMYSLPFTKFTAGGDGTPDNPYLISTLGDMQQMKIEPTASYRLVNDIDMDGYPTEWKSIENFTGTLDGDGHTLKNFVISSDDYNIGLFGTLGNGSKVKNLVIINPELTLNSNNAYAGIIAGQSVTDSISNVHIYGASITGTDNTAVGGFVGLPALYSEISGSSFDGTINVPGAESVGGIAGETRTGTDVVACAVKGNLTATSSLGGIVGTTGTDSEVLDCHADVTLEANNTVGGIVGTNGSRAAVSRNYVSGTIKANSANKWNGLSLGGIVGYLSADWSNSSAAVVNSNVMTAELVRPATEEIDKTVNRIVGWTIANESYEPGEKVYTDAGLADNYSTFATIFNGTVSDDATSVNGATIDKAGLTTDFFKGIGYAYGTEKTAPWKETSAQPVLWFENVAMGISFNPRRVTIKEGETAEVTVTVHGTDASQLELTSSDENVATFDIIGLGDNTRTIKISCKKTGTAVIKATLGELTAECVVNGVPLGIDNVTSTPDNLSIRVAAGRVEAAGASRMALYNTAGQLKARVNGDAVSTLGMAKGVYVVVATDSEGRATTAKMVVK